MSDRMVAVGLLLLVLLVFGNALASPFVWDEEVIITLNPALRSWNPLHVLTSPFFANPPWRSSSTELLRYRPLVTASYWWDYRWWRLTPFGYHLTNLAIHWLNCWLFFVIARQLSGQVGIGVLAAAAFAIHPVHPQAVSYIPSRGDLMAGLGVLLLLLGHLRWRRNPSAWRSAMAGELVAMTLALLSKEWTVFAPAFVTVYERVYGSSTRDRPLAVRLCREAAWLWTAVVLYIIVRFLWFPVGDVQWAANLVARLQLFGQTATLYAGWLLWPTGVRFPVPLDPGFPWWMGMFWGVVLAVGGWVAATGRGMARTRELTFAFLWCAVALVPITNLAFPLGPPLAANYLYTMAMGACLAFGAVSWRFATRTPSRIRRALVGVTLVAIGGWWTHETVQRSRVWGHPPTLFRMAIEAGPPYAEGAYMHLTAYYLERGDFRKALAYSLTAIAHEPTASYLYVDLGLVYQQMGRFLEAEAAYRTALALNPQSALAYNNLATLALKQGTIPEAVEYADTAVRISPSFVEALGNLAEALMAAGHQRMALEAMARATQLAPDDNRYWLVYGDMLLAAGAFSRATEVYEHAARLAPDIARPYLGLATALGQQHRWGPAVQAHRRAVALAPKDPATYVNYGVTLARMGRYEDAIAQWRRALAFAPDREDVKQFIARAQALQQERQPSR